MSSLEPQAGGGSGAPVAGVGETDTGPDAVARQDRAKTKAKGAKDCHEKTLGSREDQEEDAQKTEIQEVDDQGEEEEDTDWESDGGVELPSGSY